MKRVLRASCFLTKKMPTKGIKESFFACQTDDDRISGPLAHKKVAAKVQCGAEKLFKKKEVLDSANTRIPSSSFNNPRGLYLRTIQPL